MLRWLFDRLGISQGWCVEIGAWDGMYLSNTWALWHDHGWHAVLIEADRPRWQELIRRTAQFERVTPVNAHVTGRGPHSLDALLTRAGAPAAFELLSVDVDGEDYRIWESCVEFRPAVVVIEYNGSFPPTIDHVQEPGDRSGASALALERLAQAKGYRLLDLTPTNLLFLADEHVERLDVPVLPLGELFDDSGVPVAFSDYDGVHRFLQTGPWGYTGASLKPSASSEGRLTSLRRRLARRLSPP